MSFGIHRAKVHVAEAGVGIRTCQLEIDPSIGIEFRQVHVRPPISEPRLRVGSEASRAFWDRTPTRGSLDRFHRYPSPLKPEASPAALRWVDLPWRGCRQALSVWTIRCEFAGHGDLASTGIVSSKFQSMLWSGALSTSRRIEDQGAWFHASFINNQWHRRVLEQIPVSRRTQGNPRKKSDAHVGAR
jgi:hypothetical protein